MQFAVHHTTVQLTRPRQVHEQHIPCILEKQSCCAITEAHLQPASLGKQRACHWSSQASVPHQSSHLKPILCHRPINLPGPSYLSTSVNSTTTCAMPRPLALPAHWTANTPLRLGPTPCFPGPATAMDESARRCCSLPQQRERLAARALALCKRAERGPSRVTSYRGRGRPWRLRRRCARPESRARRRCPSWAARCARGR